MVCKQSSGRDRAKLYTMFDYYNRGELGVGPVMYLSMDRLISSTNCLAYRIEVSLYFFIRLGCDRFVSS